jgi:DnaJ family protein C protein 1
VFSVSPALSPVPTHTYDHAFLSCSRLLDYSLCLCSALTAYQPHHDGTITPLSTLAQPPSFLRTWPFTLSISISRKALSYLPASVQSNLPSSLQSIGEDIESDEESDDGPEDTPTPAPRRRGRANELRKGDRGRGSGASTPATSSPGTTEVESEGEEATGGEGVQKKKRGPGKAAAMRRRKMGKGK